MGANEGEPSAVPASIIIASDVGPVTSPVTPVQEIVLTPSLPPVLPPSPSTVPTLTVAEDGTVALGISETLVNANDTVTVAITGESSASAVTINTYDRAIYDKSKNNVWATATEKNLGAQSLPMTLTLQPWSMNVVRVAP